MSQNDLKDKIKQTPISYVLRHYLNLKKQGANFVAICPFHKDSNPSLHVNDTKGLFRCFACDIGGDSFTFVQKKFNVSFLESLTILASLLDIPLPEPSQNKFDDEKEKLTLNLLKSCALIYHKIALSKKHVEFNKFIVNRELNQDMIDTFQLGYATADSTITHYLYSIKDEKKKKLALEIAVEIGLIRTSVKDSTYPHFDSFRNRIIFPIFNPLNKIVGFSSRAVFDYQKAKYYNSPESFIFNKRKLLYGLNLSRKEISKNDQVIIVEGHMDLIALYKSGIKNCCATMGVALSEQSINIIKRLTENVVLGLDSDIAGMQAMKRMNKTFLQYNIAPLYIDFTPEKDPDDYLVKYGVEQFKRLLSSSQTILDKILDDIIPSSPPSGLGPRLKLLNTIFEELSPLKSSLIAREKVLECAAKLNLKSSPEQIIEIYQNHLNETNAAGSKASYKDLPHKIATPRNNPNLISPPPNFITLSKIECSILQELILHPECLQDELITEILEYVDQVEVKRFFLWLNNLYYEIDDTEISNVVLNYLQENNFDISVKEKVGSILFRYNEADIVVEKVKNKLVSDLLNRLKKDKLIKVRNQLRAQQKTVLTQENSANLLGKLTKIDREINQLKNNI
ncbi:DNA primase [Bacteriovoracaceae bacterium]|nr:DNA primase [Bacteriovoracaceae bacterium]